MAKREFVMHAHPLNLKKHAIGGWFLSEKMDGSRAIWDGGVSRGLPASQVPWANTASDHIRRTPPVATGLWSRYGNIIHAPESFLDQLPPYFLDGELTAGRGEFQDTRSIVAKHVPDAGWERITFMVLDSPRPDIIFENGVLNHKNYKKTFAGIPHWLTQRAPEIVDAIPFARYATMQSMHGWLMNNLTGSQYVELAQQERLPAGNTEAVEVLEKRLEEILEGGGEGVVLRRPTSMWLPERSWDCLKYKPYEDAEGVVTGFIWGRRTELGSKLLGKMGALVLDYNGKRLELSGFTDAEREMTFYPFPDERSQEQLQFAALHDGDSYAGEKISRDWYNKQFPIGSVVTFRYRELSDAGIPKEARFHRKRANSEGEVR